MTAKVPSLGVGTLYLFTLDNILEIILFGSYVDMGHVGHSIPSANIISRNNNENININNLRN